MPREFKAAMRVAKKKKKAANRKELRRHYNLCGCHKLTNEEKAEKKAAKAAEAEAALEASPAAGEAKKGYCACCSSKGAPAAVEGSGAVELAPKGATPEGGAAALETSAGSGGGAVSLDGPEASPALKEGGKKKTPPPRRPSAGSAGSASKLRPEGQADGDEAPAAAPDAEAPAPEGGAPASALQDESEDEEGNREEEDADGAAASFNPVFFNPVFGGAPGEPEADVSRGLGTQALGSGVRVSAADALRREAVQEKAAKAVAASEEAARVAASTRAATVAEAMAEADENMDGVDQATLKEKAANYQRINLPRVGRFDVQWPGSVVEPFTVSFPAIKPAKLLREDVASLIEPPSDSAATSPLARRYQFGWVLVLMHEASPSGKRVYLRLPAYVSHKQRALGTLDPDDFASPYSNRLHGAAAGDDGDATAAAVRAAKAEARIAALEAELAALKDKAAADPTATPGGGTNSGEEYKDMGTGL
jgi:hypothetical protein